MVDRVRVLRRALHMSYALCLLYYAVPDPVPLAGVPRPLAALSGVLMVGALEAWRIRRRSEFFLLREYERGRVAAYFWLGLGCIMALVFFRPAFAIPAILGTAFCDPLMGELRPHLGNQAAIMAGFFAWGVLAQAASTLSAIPLAPPLLVAGAASAALAEGKRIPRVDDDLLMTLAPLAAMALFAGALGM